MQPEEGGRQREGEKGAPRQLSHALRAPGTANAKAGPGESPTNGT